ncbi:SAM-dependent methyltransferase [Paenibacillus flagellatus]|uniref:XRE family transcriptional regulator n=1 Tax=Paenibacillus flagellatus TaxID=2211139 RepID=A0A2V5K403_9BACL|nr:methyltransferase domain-containing protein [Paenibacillus flagellatus]PYI53971.1 XRE family transcriptional regulator [Paenibacillus flagellatus]
MDKEQLQRLYGGTDYYWGKEPSFLAGRVAQVVPPDKKAGATLLDLGAGEGRDSVRFAELGFDVVAVDWAPAGLAKASRLADERGVRIATREADLNDFAWEGEADVVYSIGALQYIRPDRRAEQFRRFRDGTAPGGVHVLFAFVDHPDVAPAPDWGVNEYLYGRDELMRYYDDAGWETLAAEERIFDCDSSGVPHRHAASVLIVRKRLA